MRKMLSALVLTLAFAPALASSSVAASRHMAASRPQPAPLARAGHVRAGDVFGMETTRSFGIDPNAPAVTGGGSVGYNRDLLKYY